MIMKRFIISSRFLRGAHINLRECPRTGEKRLFPKSHKLKKEMLQNPAIFGRTNIQLNVDCGSSLRLRICVFHCGKQKHCFWRFDIFLEINYSSRNKTKKNTEKLKISFWSDFQRFNNLTNFGRRNYFRKRNQRFHKHGNEAK